MTDTAPRPERPRGTRQPAANLAEWLSGRSDDELADLLRLRPDLAVPPPATVAVLAGRAEQRTSVMRVADGLTSLHFSVIELLALERAEEAPVTFDVLRDAVNGRVPVKELRRVLDMLRARALVWGDDTGLRLVPAATSALPWRVGRAIDGATTLGEDEIVAALERIEPAERNLLDTLAGSSPLGRTRDAAPGTPPDRPVQRLLAAQLLRWIDDDTVELPHEVGQVLRGEVAYDPASLRPPPVRTTHHKPADVNAAAAGEALELIRHGEDVLAALGASPAPVLRAGGLGVRELKRLVKATGIDETRLGVVVEILVAAGLVAAGPPDPPVSDTGDSYWAPTTAADSWLNASTAHRWYTLAGAWYEMPRMPWFIGQRDSADKPIAALSEEGRAPSAPEDRRAILSVLAELEPGDAVPPADVSVSLSWQRPRWSSRLRTRSVENTLHEAAAVGLVARGALSSPGRALLHGGDTEAQMAQVLPDPIDYVLVQADLTIVAPGPLTADLLDRVTLVADIESAGAASMYRISEDSIRRALDAGMTAAEIRALFGTHSRTPVPQSLTYLVDDVARRHGRLRAGVASSFLRCEDPALLAEVLASPVAEALALRALAPTVAVSQAPLRAVLEELRAAGFAPAGEDSSGALVDLRPRGARVPVRRNRSGRTRAVATPDAEQLASMVRTMRAGDLAADTGKTSGIRSDGSRASSAATVAMLATAARNRTSVAIGYVDAQGVAMHRIVDPIGVGGGQLEAFDPGTGAVRRFTLHRIISVRPVE
ncbi:DNA-binding protein [Rhodococcus triatomae]|uniref:Helicase conserved C-terminal domain-containing protein n=1 Tax=Rhodococcus triatomae TaxID=300028 RepID=A0A1G8ATW5_9NOCA|nr:helicase-associated domain-containing protein [Rhodococcus triatomae]QNG17676.1 DNA-binding protein [Rhodococcus triatomae]QNG22657.1 DNA-binding protein [Rhodococcus triatomae]SDH24243.1 Helicase conserved C-terminal domain-containing protein [Rhodococcus triatomae]